jgi:hypothetical protein
MKKDQYLITIKYGGTIEKGGYFIRNMFITTYEILETLDWRIVTASPIEGFLLRVGVALKDLVA